MAVFPDVALLVGTIAIFEKKQPAVVPCAAAPLPLLSKRSHLELSAFLGVGPGRTLSKSADDYPIFRMASLSSVYASNP